MKNRLHGYIAQVEQFILDYCSFTDPAYAFVGALWAIATHCYMTFDSFPYMVITSKTKQSGKTRFGAEVLSFLSFNPFNAAGPTEATLFRKIDKGATIIIDEAEALGSERDPRRALLNVGYRKGTTYPRTIWQEVIEFKTYGPKILMLIGDVYDTLRDRSIVVNMMRAKPRKEFLYEEAKLEGNMLAKEADRLLGKDGVRYEDLKSIYEDMSRNRSRADIAGFLAGDRDREIWVTLFAVCKTLHPERLPELQKAAADLCGLKTAPAKVFRKSTEHEDAALYDQYRERLIKDIAEISKGKNMPSKDILEKLLAMPLAPWRTFRGEGLGHEHIGHMLKHLLRTRPLRFGKKVQKGYAAEDVKKALASFDKE